MDTIQEYSGFRVLGGQDGFATQKIAYPLEYFSQRECVLDCRSPGAIEIEDGAHIGWFVRFICVSHNVGQNRFGELITRRVVVRKGAFVAAYATLYNCEIGEGSVVALGAVVRSMSVEPWTMVEGNPARPFRRRRKDGTWEKIA